MNVNRFEDIGSQTPDHQNPLRVKLRGKMKRAFLETLQRTVPPFDGTSIEGANFIIYGGTLMFLAKENGTRFPIHNQKSDDIDMGLHIRGEAPNLQDVVSSTLAPYIHDLIDNCGFTIAGSGKGTSTSVLVSKTFSRDEIDELLFSYPELTAYAAGMEEISVYLEIDLNPRKLPLLLAPQPYLSPIDSPTQTIVVDDLRNMLAKKLVRSSQPVSTADSGMVIRAAFKQDSDPAGFKPRDLVDIYNILHAKPPLLSFDTEDIELLRTLMVVNFGAMGREPDKINLEQFAPTPENIKAFRESMVGRIAQTFHFDDTVITHLLSSVAELHRTIFPEHSKETPRSILLPEERRFLEKLRGYETLPGTSQTRIIDPSIDISLLKNIHTDVFSRNPELESLVATSPSLKANIALLEEKRSAARF